MLQPLAGVLQRDVHLPTHSLAVVEEKVLVFLPILGLVLSLLPRLGVTQNHVDFGALAKAEETHRTDVTVRNYDATVWQETHNLLMLRLQKYGSMGVRCIAIVQTSVHATNCQTMVHCPER